MAFLLIFCIVFSTGNVFGHRAEDYGKPKDQITVKTELPLILNNGMVGVASVAGITSRNGRVSTVGGIHFYPHFNHHRYETSIKPPIRRIQEYSYNNKDLKKHRDDEIMNTYSSNNPSMADKTEDSRISNNWSHYFDPVFWPNNDYLFRDPIDLHKSRQKIEEWIHRDVMDTFVPHTMKYKNLWLYPSFNPVFN